MADFNIEFKDKTKIVINAIKEIAPAVLEECCGELESEAKRNTRVDTGQTKNAWAHKVSSHGTKYEGVVGNPLQNAIWEEVGTGEYALQGNGRKGGWVYVDEKGNGHFTYGKRPSRAFFKAYTSLKGKLIKHIQDAFKGGLA